MSHKTINHVYKPSINLEIPDVDILTLLFDHTGCHSNNDTLLHIDAAVPFLALNKFQARNLTRRIAYALRAHYNIGSRGDPGIVTCISSGNHILPCVFYGCVAAGGIFSAVSSTSTSKDLTRVLKNSSNGLIVCSPDTKQTAIVAANECNISHSHVLEIDAPAGAIRRLSDGSNVITSRAMDWAKITDRTRLSNTPVCLIYSSGTTGLPKGVPLSHRNLVASCIIANECFSERIKVFNPQFAYRTIAHLPTAHIAGLQGYFINPVYMGGPVYWMQSFDFQKFLHYNRIYRITFSFTVPPIYLQIAKSTSVTDHFKYLEVALSGAAPLSKELQYSASSKLGKAFINQTWGLSETTGSATVLPYPFKDDTGSVSSLIPNVEARVIDADGNDVAPGDIGEILLRGPNVFAGYCKNESANNDAFLDGWFRTGDIGQFKNGLVYLVDRKKELIKYNGLQVAPAELEGLLLSHSSIQDAAVIGVKWRNTEAPRAYIVADPKVISANEVAQFIKNNVAKHKQLRGGVIFVPSIPKSPSGKILRRELRDMAKLEIGQQTKL